ncbi:putative aldo/keto reductase [Escherichia coli]|uniref:Putative aldo/keto reductase n=1 Tax=Escherichia coli TaxID=562 RepID=A0A376U8G5_ECOLX|nr:putative aldo/keto reductase [Escherichia coli]
MQQKMIQFSGDVSLPAIGQGHGIWAKMPVSAKQKLLHYARALSSV